MKTIILSLFISLSAFSQVKFQISFQDKFSKTPLDGRLMVLISNNDKAEPRFQIKDEVDTQQIFGADVENWQPNQVFEVNASNSFGYPIKNLNEFPAGEYYLQVVLHRYETFKRKVGPVVKLPMDKGEGQNWRLTPHNLYSKPIKISFNQKGVYKVVLDNENPEIEQPKDTKYIKHVKIQSKMLSEWWGRPMFLAAHVLLPSGFDEHPEARYPLCVYHGHFPDNLDGFSETPPPANMDTTDYIERFGIYGYKKLVAQESYNFYKQWTSPNFPRFLVIEIQHPTPYYDDSYAVNSANQGPYGDAITYELIPEIEKRFRGIGQGWARFMYGGSTGGWEALAAQIFYPDEYNGCFAACPDPIAFDAFTSINLYKDKNAYYNEGSFKKTKKPGKRNYLGQIACTVEDMNHRELALGTKSRSGDQYDIWEATYSPMGEDGYPKPIYNKLTGEIDPKVAEHWRENYDLLHILKRDWSKIGVKLQGKIHLYCGDMDNYYLNNAVYLMEGFLKKTSKPNYHGEVDYGDRAEHCWNGDHNNPNYISRLRYNTMYIPKWLKRIELSAPKGADLTSWRY